MDEIYFIIAMEAVRKVLPRGVRIDDQDAQDALQEAVLAAWQADRKGLDHSEAKRLSARAASRWFSKAADQLNHEMPAGLTAA